MGLNSNGPQLMGKKILHEVLGTKTEQHKCMATQDNYIMWQEEERVRKIS